MGIYKNILLAVELHNDEEKKATKKAVALAKEHEAKLTLVHAIEHIRSYGAAYGAAVGVEIEEMLQKNAKKDMGKLGDLTGVDTKDQIIEFGPAKTIILEEAEKIKADLIIVSSHGRHGVRLLLGSTANAVLHGAKCDVLAVRVPEEKAKAKT